MAKKHLLVAIELGFVPSKQPIGGKPPVSVGAGSKTNTGAAAHAGLKGGFLHRWDVVVDVYLQMIQY